MSYANQKDKFQKLVDEYRPTMPVEVMHLWAKDMIGAVSALSELADELEKELNDWNNGDARGVMAHMDAFRERAIAAESERDKLAARVEEAVRVMEPFAAMIAAMDKLSADGQRKLQPTESAKMSDAEISALVMPDSQVVLTDGRMAFGHSNAGSTVKLLASDFRAARAFTKGASDAR